MHVSRPDRRDRLLLISALAIATCWVQRASASARPWLKAP